MSAFTEYLDRAKRQYGDKFDSSALYAADSKARDYYQGSRVLVETVYSDGVRYRRAGVVSATTGWKPSLLLMHRVSDIGSSDLIGPNDKVIAVQSGGKYYELRTGKVIAANLGYTEPEN